MRTLVLAALASMTASTAFAQMRPLVTITVDADPPHTAAHTIEIASRRDSLARTTEELETGGWTATRISGQGTETITSETCPPLRRLALAFGFLPPLEIRPSSLKVAPGPLPIPPTRKDGISTTLSFETETTDGSMAEVAIRGGNAYAQWGHDVVGDLRPCWAPLLP